MFVCVCEALRIMLRIWAIHILIDYYDYVIIVMVCWT